MEKYIVEIIKDIKRLEEEKTLLLHKEMRTCEVTYIEGTEKPETEYNYGETRYKIQNIDHEIRKNKFILNQANYTTMVEEFNMTLGECLVLLAQLNHEKNQIHYLGDKEALSRYVDKNGNVQLTAATYDVNTCKNDLKAISQKINRLQIAIDRINLNTKVDF